MIYRLYGIGAKLKRGGAGMDGRTYIAIDLKSFYASVERVERGLDESAAHPDLERQPHDAKAPRGCRPPKTDRCQTWQV